MPPRYQRSDDGLLQTGLTRNQTPCLLYPPEPNGRHASMSTYLQYADPQQLAAAQHQEYVLGGQIRQPANVQSAYTGPNPYAGGQAHNGSGNLQAQDNQQATSPQGQGQPATTQQSSSTGGDGPQGGQTATGNGLTLPPPRRFWFCCNCGAGPYDVDIHNTCVTNCGMLWCSNCRMEIIYPPKP